jgi:nucleotidyltransferase/DNA polymerase involved in DNA repair
MRIAFVSIPRFACAVEAQRNPLCAQKPLIVGDSEQPKRVLDCSSEAHKQGVRPEMTVRQALGYCPDAVVVSPDPVLYRSVWERVLDAFADVTPEVEEKDLGSAYLNVGGLTAHYRDEASLCERIIDTVRDACGLEASLGQAEGKFPSLAASTTATPGQARIVPRGEEAGFLAPLPVELLPLETDLVDRLHLFGLETIGEVAALSQPELQSQFGFSGKRLWHLVNGIDDDPLKPRPPTEKLADSFFFEDPVAGIDVMVAVARQLLSRLRPALNGRAARELTLQAELASSRGWERRLVFREAVSESERLLFVLRSTLQNAPPPQAVRSLSLRLSGLTGETGKQLSLGEHGRLQRQLEETIQQLKARYGFSPIYRCVDVEAWSVVPEERQILVESDA